MLTVADTAYSIAVVRAEEAARPEHERLFEDPYAAIFSAAGKHAREGTERFLGLPFFREGIRLRTRFIDDAVREGLDAGLRQLVLFGAGFDMRGLRMPEVEASATRVFEIDFLDQLERKRELLSKAGVSLPAWTSYVGCDFASDFESALGDAMQAKGFRIGAGAMFVWEGVLGYIDTPAIDRSLRCMATAGGQSSRIVFNHGLSTFDPEGAASRTRRTGFSTCEETGYEVLWRQHWHGEPHPGAYVCRMGVATV